MSVKITVAMHINLGRQLQSSQRASGCGPGRALGAGARNEAVSLTHPWACRYGKIGYAARLLAFAEREGDRPPGDRLDARGPEAVGKPCVGKGNRLEGVIRGCSAAPATRQQSDQNNQ